MKYKSKTNLLEELKSLPYFTKERIYQLGKNDKIYNLKNSTLDTYISRYLKNREIIALKRGMYISNNFYHKNSDDLSYIYFLANIIRKPSYISSWTALEYYGLSTEVINSTISVTTKVTRNYETKIGNFTYKSIKNDLFTNFSLINKKFNFYIAPPSKALFDMLYFKTRQYKDVKYHDIDLLIKELRVDIKSMDKKEVKKFNLMIKDYYDYG
ncbi:MAG: hypothetical protein U5L76_01310 [Patescibacteria group bacterium]|nr:hypothetical protein [Patescibacteria group bacterium]